MYKSSYGFLENFFSSFKLCYLQALQQKQQNYFYKYMWHVIILILKKRTCWIRWLYSLESSVRFWAGSMVFWNVRCLRHLKLSGFIIGHHNTVPVGGKGKLPSVGTTCCTKVRPKPFLQRVSTTFHPSVHCLS